ncbi:MAG: hypothetical protein V3R64_06120 [Sphingomonadales bacterium]
MSIKFKNGFPNFARKLGTLLLAISFFLPMARCDENKDIFNYNQPETTDQAEIDPDWTYYYPFEVFTSENFEDGETFGYVVLFLFGFFWPIGFLILERKHGPGGFGPGVYFAGTVLTGAMWFAITLPFMFFEPFIGALVVFVGSSALLLGFGVEAYRLIKARMKDKKQGAG